MKKVLVASSGGVDSAVAAALLKKQGYHVSCAYMRTWIDETSLGIFADCPWEEDIQSAKAVASHIELPFEVLNLINDYQKRVVKYLVEGYQRGITPNPDIMCNREMKFGVLLNYALENGFDALATGHYCRLKNNEDGSVDLLQGLDPNKDQSYFLALVKQEALKKVLFPIGDYQKSDIRKLAEEFELPNAKRKDSQGICFLGKVPINKFLNQYIEERPGPIINHHNKVVGEHKGLHRYTLGQRKGIAVPSNTDFENYVVISKDYDTNTLFVAFDKPETPGLYTQDIDIHSIHFINKSVDTSMKLLAKPRYRDPSQEIEFTALNNGSAHIHFEARQRALAPGQVLALYEGEKLLGGGYYK